MIDDSLMFRAIKQWGEDLQIALAQEECAELIVAIAHKRRGRESSTENLIEEIADVKIMVRQLELMFGAEAVEKVVQAKMARLARRLERNQFEG